jgi:hypothetical protein
MDGWLALYHTDDDLIHGQYPIRGLSSAGADGMETGSPCRVLYIGPITEYPITLLYLPLVRAANCSVHLSSPHRGLSSGSILQRVCGPFICVILPFYFLSFCWQAPARTCALILCDINSTDPRFPAGLWAPFASHRLQTFVVWGYRLPKN